MTDIHASQNPHISQMPEMPGGRNSVAAFLRVLPVIQWAMTIAIAIAVFALTTRDTQQVQSSEIGRILRDQQDIRATMAERKTEREKQIEELKREMLTKQVFEAYHSADLQRLERIEKMLEEILKK